VNDQIQKDEPRRKPICWAAATIYYIEGLVYVERGSSELIQHVPDLLDPFAKVCATRSYVLLGLDIEGEPTVSA
jgi:hypothetical protein